jgi:hypothetical protein
MASKLWIYEPEEGRYIRGSEIIEARVRTLRPTSGDQRSKQFAAVVITQARTRTDAGTAPREWDLWVLDDRPTAERAVKRLLGALSADFPAIAYLDADDEVQTQPCRARPDSTRPAVKRPVVRPAAPEATTAPSRSA